MKVLIIEGVVLPGRVHALPGETHEVPDRLGKQLIYERRAVATPGELVDALPDPPMIPTRAPRPSEPEMKAKGGRR